jgi:hypothetical protein
VSPEKTTAFVEREAQRVALVDRRVEIAQRRDGDTCGVICAAGVGDTVGVEHRAFGVGVDAHEAAQVGPALVGDANLDVVAHRVPVASDERRDAGGAVDVDRRGEPVRPGIVEQRARIDAVIRVQMREQQMTDRGQRDAGLDQPQRRAVAGVEDERHAAHDQRVGAGQPRTAQRRPALGAEEDQTVGHSDGLSFAARRRPSLPIDRAARGQWAPSLPKGREKMKGVASFFSLPCAGEKGPVRFFANGK